jgi:hypothetical protein
MFWTSDDTPSDTIAEVVFQLSDKKTVYNRQVFGVLDFLGSLGGFSTVVFAIGGVFVSSFASADLKLSLVSQIFKTKISRQMPPFTLLSRRKL